jgi:hypothetical protein
VLKINGPKEAGSIKMVTKAKPNQLRYSPHGAGYYLKS